MGSSSSEREERNKERPWRETVWFRKNGTVYPIRMIYMYKCFNVFIFTKVFIFENVEQHVLNENSSDKEYSICESINPSNHIGLYL